MENFKKRRRIFIKNSIQGRYLRFTVISMIVPTLLVTLCLYYLIFTLTAAQLAIPESIAQNLFPVLKKVTLILGIGLPIVLILMFLWGVIISHQLAGPIFRLERDLEKIAAGDYTLRIKFRKNDRLDSLARKINFVLERLKK